METAERAIHLFFLVEALPVTVGYTKAPGVEHVADLQTVQDALHLPSTRPLVTYTQTHTQHSGSSQGTWTAGGMFKQQVKKCSFQTFTMNSLDLLCL